MAYELKVYLKSINNTKENLMDGDDPLYEKKYSSFIMNKCLAPFNDTVFEVTSQNEPTVFTKLFYEPTQCRLCRLRI